MQRSFTEPAGVTIAASQAGWVKRLDELHLLSALRIAALLAVGLLLTAIVPRVVDRLAQRVITLPGSDKQRSSARQHAVGTVLRSTLIGVVWATVVITIISELGVNIGAFVATATIIGGALAFGAQTLVRDAIAGFFVIAEDQYGVGDAVDVGHAVGTVERITLRSVRLRDGEGRVWHIPHGGVVRTANLSKSPKVLLDVEIARSSLLSEVHQTVRSLCDDLFADPDLADCIASRPTVEGLAEMKDDRLVYRSFVDARPGTADRIRRVWRSLVINAFQTGRLIAPEAPSTVVNIATSSADQG